MDENQQNLNQPNPAQQIQPVQQVQPPIQNTAPIIQSDKKITSLKSITTNFIINFVVYQLIFVIAAQTLMGIIATFLADKLSSIAMAYVIAVVLLVVFNTIICFLTIILTIKSTFRKNTIEQAIVPNLFKNIKIFFIVLIILTGVAVYYNGNNLIYSLANVVTYSAVSFGMMGYIKNKLVKASI